MLTIAYLCFYQNHVGHPVYLLFRCLTSVWDDICQSALLCLVLMEINTDMMWDSWAELGMRIWSGDGSMQRDLLLGRFLPDSYEGSFFYIFSSCGFAFQNNMQYIRKTKYLYHLHISNQIHINYIKPNKQMKSNCTKVPFILM